MKLESCSVLPPSAHLVETFCSYLSEAGLFLESPAACCASFLPDPSLAQADLFIPFNKYFACFQCQKSHSIFFRLLKIIFNLKTNVRETDHF